MTFQFIEEFSGLVESWDIFLLPYLALTRH